MTRPANRLRGEASLEIDGTAHVLRPSFENLVAAEEEIGSLFALVERASEGALTAREIAALLWHCLADENRPPRDKVGEAVLAMGLVAATGPVRTILAQVLQGRG
ncbi:gene transfer agent family protein [Erythrobacter sp.]|uniref:gene transfer agent family protein n=1 Tax=Erythrobacter sp. TaxID=1042 RepID=UPI001425C4F4|nr:gene transfer agent family protein [Erythrobacter sp.]QIQ87699.1 MAG: gene transfer agent family protein [Erythrobacter sp.]